MKYKYIVPVIVAAAVTSQLSAVSYTAEDFCDIKTTTPKSVKDMIPLSDGQSYTAISDNGKEIEIFSYKTGKKTGTLFSLDNIKGDLKISEFDGYEISKNEKKILLWNDTKKIYRHSFTAEYFVYDILRGTLKRVSTNGRQRGAVMSHDGRMVAYTRDNNIFISNLGYGTDRQITEDGEVNKIINGVPDWGYEEEFGIINTIRWSADDNVIAYIRFDETDVPTYKFDDYSGYCEPVEEYIDYPGEFKYKYPLAGYNNSVVSVKAYNLDTRATKTMDLPIGEKDYVPSMEFAGNTQDLMVMILNRDQNDLNLYKVNTGSTVGKLTLNERSSAWLNPSAYQMVDYGETFFVMGSERTGYCHLYQYDYNGVLQRTVTSGDFNVTSYYGRNTKNGTYYFQCTKMGAENRNVGYCDSKGKFGLLNPVSGTESAKFNSSFDYYVRSYSSAETAPQYTLCSSKGNKLADLEMNAEYASKYTGAPKREFLKVKNGAGEEMNAFIIKPADFDASRKYPLLMYQYNGPGSQEVLNSWKIDGLYYIASQGYIVACVDGRGTGGRSRSWSDAVYKNLGHYEVIDQLAGARHFMSLPYIDENRAACFGWSYGGYMTLMELSEPGTPFKAGVSMAPVTDWRFYDSIYTERFMLTPQQNEAGYDSASALLRTPDMNSRLLIMSGTADDNVHFYNTLKYTSKLTSEGKIYDMMAYTAFEHSLRMCNARTMLFKKIVDFLDTHVK